MSTYHHHEPQHQHHTTAATNNGHVVTETGSLLQELGEDVRGKMSKGGQGHLLGHWDRLKHQAAAEKDDHVVASQLHHLTSQLQVSVLSPAAAAAAAAALWSASLLPHSFSYLIIIDIMVIS